MSILKETNAVERRQITQYIQKFEENIAFADDFYGPLVEPKFTADEVADHLGKSQYKHIVVYSSLERHMETQPIFDWLAKQTLLKTLRVCMSYHEQKQFAFIFNVLDAVKHQAAGLTRLSLEMAYGVNLEPVPWPEMHRFILACKNLREIEIVNFVFNGNMMRDLCDAMTAMPFLREFKLMRSTVQSEDQRLFLRFLQQKQSLISFTSSFMHHCIVNLDEYLKVYKFKSNLLKLVLCCCTGTTNYEIFLRENSSVKEFCMSVRDNISITESLKQLQKRGQIIVNPHIPRDRFSLRVEGPVHMVITEPVESGTVRFRRDVVSLRIENQEFTLENCLRAFLP